MWPLHNREPQSEGQPTNLSNVYLLSPGQSDAVAIRAAALGSCGRGTVSATTSSK